METEYRITQITGEAQPINRELVLSRIRDFYQKTNLLDAEDIELLWDRGIIILLGLVSSYEERVLAQVIAQEISGYNLIINKIKTRRQSGNDTISLNNKLAKLLFRNPWTVSSTVRFRQLDNKMLLEGDVYSVQASLELGHMARELVRDMEVINRLKIINH